jgi:hypothetical protein
MTGEDTASGTTLKSAKQGLKRSEDWFEIACHVFSRTSDKICVD